MMKLMILTGKIIAHKKGEEIMSRLARKKSELGLYHVVQKGINGRALFYDTADYEKYIEILNKLRQQSSFRIYCCCLMENHVHLLVEKGVEDIEIIFKRIGVSYAKYYNRKNDSKGPVFVDRYWSEAVCNESYYYEVIRYICQNPVKAGLCSHPFEYLWVGCAGHEGPFLLDSINRFTDIPENQMYDFVTKPIENNLFDEKSRKILTDTEALETLQRICGGEKATHIAEYSVERRNEILINAKRAGISYRQLARLTGIGKSIIANVCRNKRTLSPSPCPVQRT